MLRSLKAKHSFIISLIAIPVAIIFFYGTDENADYFKKGRFITNTEGWQYRYQGVIYPYGLMVSQPSLVAILSIIGILFSLMFHLFWYDHLSSKRLQ